MLFGVGQAEEDFATTGFSRGDLEHVKALTPSFRNLNQENQSPKLYKAPAQDFVYSLQCKPLSL